MRSSRCLAALLACLACGPAPASAVQSLRAGGRLGGAAHPPFEYAHPEDEFWRDLAYSSERVQAVLTDFKNTTQMYLERVQKEIQDGSLLPPKKPRLPLRLQQTNAREEAGSAFSPGRPLALLQKDRAEKSLATTAPVLWLAGPTCESGTFYEKSCQSKCFEGAFWLRTFKDKAGVHGSNARNWIPRYSPDPACFPFSDYHHWIFLGVVAAVAIGAGAGGLLDKASSRTREWDAVKFVAMVLVFRYHSFQWNMNFQPDFANILPGVCERLHADSSPAGTIVRQSTHFELTNPVVISAFAVLSGAFSMPSAADARFLVWSRKQLVSSLRDMAATAFLVAFLADLMFNYLSGPVWCGRRWWPAFPYTNGFLFFPWYLAALFIWRIVLVPIMEGLLKVGFHSALAWVVILCLTYMGFLVDEGLSQGKWHVHWMGGTLMYAPMFCFGLAMNLKTNTWATEVLLKRPAGLWVSCLTWLAYILAVIFVPMHVWAPIAVHYAGGRELYEVLDTPSAFVLCAVGKCALSLAFMALVGRWSTSPWSAMWGRQACRLGRFTLTAYAFNAIADTFVHSLAPQIFAFTNGLGLGPVLVWDLPMGLGVLLEVVIFQYHWIQVAVLSSPFFRKMTSFVVSPSWLPLKSLEGAPAAT